jgi:hypothetical protein
MLVPCIFSSACGVARGAFMPRSSSLSSPWREPMLVAIIYLATRHAEVNQV